MLSQHVHSHYSRALSDLPWQGRPVTLRVQARRFRCRNVSCPRQTFAEGLADAAPRSARRTGRLGDLQRHLGFALGGEAGARLAERLAMPTSADTLLRMVSTADNSPDAAPTPRVLAVDDWAWRRGHRYGTILVDLERNQVVDLLPDRQSDTLAAWLRRHPGVEVVARDRAGAYADGVRQGAPEAVQVADRWHLLRNLGMAVQALADQHSGAARWAARHVSEEMAAAATPVPPPAPPIRKPNAAARRSQASLERRQARYEEVIRLRAAGSSISRIAALLGADRKTVRRWLHLGQASAWRQPQRGSMLDAHEPFLDQRWTEGCHNAAQLWRELVSLGFAGRPEIVRGWATRRRREDPDPNAASARLVAMPHPPSSRTIARLLMADAAQLPEVEQGFVARLLQKAPGLADAIAIAKRLNKLLRRDSQESLNQVLDAASKTFLAEFAAGLRRDVAAVQAALDLPWTTSPAEGQINRLKMLKRTMYGRAGFPLLRARVLHAA